MINFTVGPVQSSERVLEIGGEQVPYFRTAEFSQTMLENERLMKKFSKADEDAKVLFITGSGTASMEASVINTLSKNDNVVVVNGGSFGHRFVEILTLHEIPFTEIKLNFGESLKKEHLDKIDGKKHTAFVVNIHETSTGVHYDLDLISEFCKDNNLYLIVDAISSFLADEIDMKDKGINLLITGSQKALACAPGISIVVLDKTALKRVEITDPKSLYFDFKDALKNMERGQTPFTPAVGILREINVRLKEIENAGGADKEIERTKSLALYFRNKIKDFPFEIFPESPSNGVTALKTTNVSANDIFLILKDEYEIWICPNGGELRDSVFRVGHIGCLSESDYDKLIDALYDMQKRGIF